MAPISTKGYSRYVSLMKVVLPVGIILSMSFVVAWPYIMSMGKEEVQVFDTSRPEIKENRMIKPHYMSTDKKGQPFKVDAEWAKQQTENIANLVQPEGSLTVSEGQTLDVKAKKGNYDSEKKVLNLEGGVVLSSTDGYQARTEKAKVTVEGKVIEGDVYVEGEGPTGAIRGQKGFKVESRSNGKILTLKGPSRVVIQKTTSEKKKESNE